MDKSQKKSLKEIRKKKRLKRQRQKIKEQALKKEKALSPFEFTMGDLLGKMPSYEDLGFTVENKTEEENEEIDFSKMTHEEIDQAVFELLKKDIIKSTEQINNDCSASVTLKNALRINNKMDRVGNTVFELAKKESVEFQLSFQYFVGYTDALRAYKNRDDNS